MPTEDTNIEDSAALVASPAIAAADLTQDWICDLDGARLNVIGRHQVGTVRYEIRECSADPNHVKHQPV